MLRVHSDKGGTIHRMHYLCMPTPDTLLDVFFHLRSQLICN